MGIGRDNNATKKSTAPEAAPSPAATYKPSRFFPLIDEPVLPPLAPGPALGRIGPFDPK
jgi:hypothetical protein